MPRMLVLALVACGDRNPSHAADGKGAAEPAAAAPSSATAAAAPSAPKAVEIPAVVAEVGGVSITWDEVFADSASALIEAEVALDEARRNAVDGLIMQRLVEAEAKKLGTTSEALFQSEAAKAPIPTDAEIESFYNKNASQMPGPLEQVRPQLVGYLQQQKATEVVQAYISKLRAENAVKVLLPPYRVPIEAGAAPRKGSATAPVQIIEFSDFQCPFCGTAAETVQKVMDTYGDKVSVAYRHYPLPMHPQAERAAQASMCANDQGGFWKFHDALFADRKAWTDEDYKEYAKKAKLDPKKLVDCLEKGAHVATVKQDIEDGGRAGMGGTPGFYINGIVLTGARPYEDFAQVIDAELARVNAR